MAGADPPPIAPPPWTRNPSYLSALFSAKAFMKVTTSTLPLSCSRSRSDATPSDGTFSTVKFSRFGCRLPSVLCSAVGTAMAATFPLAGARALRDVTKTKTKPMPRHAARTAPPTYQGHGLHVGGRTGDRVLAVGDIVGETRGASVETARVAGACWTAAVSGGSGNWCPHLAHLTRLAAGL